jgi:hypothetical protein
MHTASPMLRNLAKFLRSCSVISRKVTLCVWSDKTQERYIPSLKPHFLAVDFQIAMRYLISVVDEKRPQEPSLLLHLMEEQLGIKNSAGAAFNLKELLPNMSHMGKKTSFVSEVYAVKHSTNERGIRNKIENLKFINRYRSPPMTHLPTIVFHSRAMNKLGMLPVGMHADLKILNVH